ncbi:MAG: 3-methyl-2-oxobutanoate hydroxymethyltransferase [Candidatus Omnitrophica bacterium]|nr:3-methyl-2-oxobutanoate hydroxymethyltransferase [Candidatus Omnitrophota bacterium]
MDQKKHGHAPWVVVTAYDAPTASLLERSGVDWVLVGDSVATVLLGYAATSEVTLDEMTHHVRAVRRGLRTRPLIADMPLCGMGRSAAEGLESALQLKRADADAIKIENGPHALEVVRACVAEGIECLGHVGLTPQALVPGESPKARGRSADEAAEIIEQAIAFEKAGACAVVIECVPAEVSRRITAMLKVPTIGIGSGAFCDGQVLVYQDLVGATSGPSPRFVKRYADLSSSAGDAVGRFAADVRAGRYPAIEHTYPMPPAELERLEEKLDRSARP